MGDDNKLQIPRVKLGNQGLEVSKLGFGCMNLNGVYKAPVSEEEGILVIKHAFSKGITFFDTADAYGEDSANEVLVGKALKQLPREKVQLSTKFGIAGLDRETLSVIVRGTPEYVRSCCEASLKRLDVDYIDLYFQHRVDTSVPIEDTMGELKKLVEEGKIKYIGLSEASPDTIRRAHVVHPITALQMEWSLWSRDIEEEIIPLCRELGIGIVPYSPLGRGFFGSKAINENELGDGLLASHPRFQRENLSKNKQLYDRIETLSRKHQCSPAQLALAWVLQQGNDVVPIPGTTKIRNLDDNIGSVSVKLTGQDLKEISEAVPVEEVAGGREHEIIHKLSWKFAKTPLFRKGYENSSFLPLQMADDNKLQIPRVKLGIQGLEVSKLGYGCMGLTGVYNSPVSDEEGISLIKYAFSKGITFFDTADMYGAHSNEILVGKALKQLPREKVQLATKFGIAGMGNSGMIVKGTPEYVRSCCEGSLKRLDVDYIDLYYQHRIDTSVPIEDTMGELKKLVEEGKIKYIGLSEASPDTIRRAHAVHPITALQMEWSLWTRDIEEEIVPLCRELGIGIVPYSPLGRGFFGGRTAVESLPENSLLASHPRFREDNLNKNKQLYDRIESLSGKHQCSPAQLALAWVLQQGDDIVPIPGTTKIKNLDDNIGSVSVKLTEQDMKEICDAVPVEEVAGDRIYESMISSSWKFANTPPKK
ncbi:hypothetical protein G4B88_028378 [Cannabis sativa]|uniref:NADP-dependent oxidoreductase domain-containing protein n=1 Tax=Cannabis sativa TaxID=3483 RepID=A0A7J6ELC0_CANSA|nr:hypothetical protein G4B88_028378 [Cannabis sativa]